MVHDNLEHSPLTFLVWLIILLFGGLFVFLVREFVRPVMVRLYGPLWTWTNLEPVMDSLKKITSLSKLWVKEPSVLSGKQYGVVMDKK